jgi:hypothetical protein
VYAFETLIAEHKAIQRRADTRLRIIEGDQDAETAYHALAMLLAELVAHLGHEDADLYPRLMADNGYGTTHAAAEAIAEFETLAGDWCSFATRWTSEPIDRDWLQFGIAARELIDRLARRMRTENELLYPLALRSAHIRLRA